VFAPRRLLTWILVLAALGLAVPAATLAAGGGSAGDQQYTDPFAGTPHPAGSTHTATTPPPTTTPAPTTTAPAPAASTPAPAPSTTPLPAAPPATAVTSTASAPTTARPTTLPFTGYDSWLAGALGVAMIGAGVILRRRARRV
jgi:hypothetical protein